MNRREFLASVGILGIGAFMPHEQQHYWTGSEWLAGDKMQVPESGQTRLFTVVTTSGRRLDLGDPSFPVRYWDGTDVNFSFSDAGAIYATSVLVEQIADGATGLAVDAAFATGYTMEFKAAGATKTRVSPSSGDWESISGWRWKSSLTDTGYGTFISGGSLRFGDGGTGLVAGMGWYSDNTLGVSVDNHLAWGGGSNTAYLRGASGAAHIELAEITAPAAPGTNRVVLYSQDNGAGKTQLMAKFNTGAAQQVAIQP